MGRLAALLRSRPWDGLAAAAALAGVVASIPGLATPVSLPLLLGFVLLGPGAVLQARFRLSGPTTWILVPLAGLAVVILLATGLAWFAAWEPQASLVSLAALCLLAAVAGLFSGVRKRPGQETTS